MSLEALVRAALAEDLGRRGDLTTRALVSPSARLKARVVARQAGVVCGTRVAEMVFRAVDPRARVRVLVRDGGTVRPGRAVMRVEGGRGLLTAERTALNFLQHLSGIATLTAAFARRVRGTRARIYDTRKTLPGYRALAKHAVRCGGGYNHRFGLHDMALVKDNHWAAGGDLAAALRRLRAAHKGLRVQVEAASLAQLRRALAAGPDLVLLDNMTPARLKQAIALCRRLAPGVEVEVSGGVTLRTVRALARLGPDRISVGRITHSAPALDLSLEVE